MKTLLIVLFLCISTYAFAFPPSPLIIVEEADGSPTGPVTKIVVTNDTATVSGGVATVTIPAAGSGGYQTWDADLDTAALANEASNSTYFGKDATGSIGFHSVAPVEAGTATGQILLWNDSTGYWEAEDSLTGVTIGGLSTTAGTATVSDSSGYLSQSFTNLLPDAADGAALGSADAEWSDIYLADGAVIYGQNDQSNSITSGATGWTFAKDAIMPDAGGLVISLSASDAKYSGTILVRTVDSGASNSAFGQCYHVDTDGELVPADADSADTMPCIGLAVESGTGSKRILLDGVITETDWNWTVGGLIYVGTDPATTTGLVQAAPSGTGDQVQVVGVALSADTILFKPSLILVEVE